jgi:hypothetical protein
METGGYYMNNVIFVDSSLSFFNFCVLVHELFEFRIWRFVVIIVVFQVWVDPKLFLRGRAESNGSNFGMTAKLTKTNAPSSFVR